MKVPRERFSVTALPDGRVLVVGGVDESKARGDSLTWLPASKSVDPTMLRSTEIYAPGANSWLSGPPLSESRESHTSVLISPERVATFGGTYVVDVCSPSSGGFHCRPEGGYERKTEELLDIARGAWKSALPQIGLQVGQAFNVLAGGKVIGTGGRPDGSRVVIRDPITGRWSLAGPMRHARSFHGAVTLKDGRVLVAGGLAEVAPPDTLGPAPALASCEINSPITGQWTEAGALNVPSYAPSLLELPDGRVMIKGRLGATDGTETRAEIWDPSTNQWTPTTAKPPEDGRCAPLLLAGHGVLSCSYLWQPN
jgi:hypothetical protein